jgi:hypothetical protein
MNWLKLMIPIVLGIAAGVANYLVLTSKTSRPRTAYLTVKSEIKAGQPFKQGQFTVLEVEEETAGQLSSAVMRYADRAVLYDRPSRRSLKAGDLVLHQDAGQANWEQELKEGEAVLPYALDGITTVEDLIAVGSNVGFFILSGEKPTPGATRLPERNAEYVGPFRVVGVGTRIDPLAPAGSRSGGQSKVLSLAIKMDRENKPDLLAQRLLMVRKAELETGERLVLSVVLHPNR